MNTVILIDAENRTVTEVEVATLGFESYYPLVKTDMLEKGMVDADWFGNDSNTLYVDEEATWKAPKHFFAIDGGRAEFLVGNGVITGHNGRGGEAQTKLTADDVRKHIKFMHISELPF